MIADDDVHLPGMDIEILPQVLDHYNLDILQHFFSNSSGGGVLRASATKTLPCSSTSVATGLTSIGSAAQTSMFRS